MPNPVRLKWVAKSLLVTRWILWEESDFRADAQAFELVEERLVADP
jgi:hypothetical protein